MGFSLRTAEKTRILTALVVTGLVAGGIAAGAAPAAATTQPTPIDVHLADPTGRRAIGTVSLHLVDPTRVDPFVPNHQAREIMASVWYPTRDTANHDFAPWLPPLAATQYLQENGVPPDVVNLPITVGRVGAPVERHGGGWPVLLYSPGLGTDRSFGTDQVTDLVSHGYVVVTMDPTHDAGEVQFPGNRLEVQTLPDASDATLAVDVAVRAADASFVLDKLTVINRGGNPDAEHAPLPRGLAGALDLKHVGMFGWSLGGATAANAMLADPRIRTGVNMDGSMFAPATTTPLDRPFLILSSEKHSRDNDPTWVSFWANLHGRRLDLQVTGVRHWNYSDLEDLVPPLEKVVTLPFPPDVLSQVLGPIDPRRAVVIERTYLRAWFDTTLLHRGDDHLLDGPSKAFPEVRFVR